MAADKTILKGDELMLFNSNQEAFAWATNHTLTLSTSTQEVSTKDHGVWNATNVTKISWEITTENLTSIEDYNALYDMMTNREPVTVYFGLVGNYDENGLVRAGGTVQAWQLDSTVEDDTYINYRKGNAVITNLQLNAPTGENSTFSATFTGVGPLAYETR